MVRQRVPFRGRSADADNAEWVMRVSRIVIPLRSRVARERLSMPFELSANRGHATSGE